MIRFAPQAAKQPAVPQAKAPTATGAIPAASGPSLADLLPDSEQASGAAAAKAAKPRTARKQKAVTAGEQLDLDA